MNAAERRKIKRARTVEELHAWVDDLERRIRAKVRRETDRIARVAAPGCTREDRRKEQNERSARIRALVMERADGTCEWCGHEGLVLEWAHVIDGSDKQAREDVDTTAAACADCHHRGWHGSGPRRMATLRNAKEWAIRLGFRDALAEIERKIAKAEEAQRG